MSSKSGEREGHAELRARQGSARLCKLSRSVRVGRVHLMRNRANLGQLTASRPRCRETRGARWRADSGAGKSV